MEGRYTKSVDIFSLGIAILELSSNLELPSNGPLWQSLRSGSLPSELLCRLSQELQDVIRWMMNPLPDCRPSVDTLLRLPRLAALYQERKRWRVIRGLRSYMHRKLCNLKCFLASLVLSIASCLRLKHGKPAVPEADRRRRSGHRDTLNRTYCNGISSNVRTCLMKDFDDELEDDELLSTGELDLTGGSTSTDVQITPTLNNDIPRHTPPVRMMNSTPLNHNHIGLRLSFRHNHVDNPARNARYVYTFTITPINFYVPDPFSNSCHFIRFF